MNKSHEPINITSKAARTIAFGIMHRSMVDRLQEYQRSAEKANGNIHPDLHMVIREMENIIGEMIEREAGR